MGIGASLAEAVDKRKEERELYHPYWHFEPWDCEKPSAEIIKRAVEDSVDLFGDDVAKMAGGYPRGYQTHAIMSTAKITATQGGSQVGKSITAKIKMGCMMSGEFPYCFRHDKGVDTGVHREINEWNIRRFGRFDSSTGEFIDKNVNAKKPVGWDEWNCGNIIGVGKFPEELVAPEGSQLWIGTLKESVDTMWWPQLAGEGGKRFLPDEFVQRTEKDAGTNKTERVIHCVRDVDIYIKSYESGHLNFESFMAWYLAWDEEPLTSKIFVSGNEHCVRQGFFFTPLRGLTWSKNVILGGNRDIKYFQASQYESPNHSIKDVDTRRKSYEVWDRQSRIWGRYSEQTGKPFFNRRKLNFWINKYNMRHEFARFEPTRQYYQIISKPMITSVEGLMDVPVKRIPATEEDQQAVWRIYEDVKPDTAYILCADAADGDIDPEAAADRSAALIMRADDEGRPVIVASLRSTQENLAFARTISYALRYYNNALLASERGRGKANENVGVQLEEYPYWFMFTTVQDKTGKAKVRKGFDTNARTRDIIFELIKDWVNEFEEDEYPQIPDKPLLVELAAAIVGKTAGGKARCDHPRTGTLDSAIAFGIGLWVFEHAKDQIRCNVRKTLPPQVPRNRGPQQNKRAPCNMGMMGFKGV